MSFRYLILVLIAIIGLGFFACEPENFDEIIEEVLPTDTTKVVSDKGTLQYLLQGVQNSYNNGFARLIADDLFYIIASDSIRCTADGTYSTAAQQDTGFVITFSKTLQTDFVLKQGILRRVIGNDTLVLYSGDFLRNCNAAPPVVTILRETDNFLEGKYEANFFELIGQNLNDCASWRSVGVLTAEFAVPIEICK